MADTILRDFFLGFVRIHVLHHAAEGPIYGLGMIQELARHGYEMSPGTLYPLLHGLERSGYVARTEPPPGAAGGRPRRYYAITPLGRRVLAEAREKMGELVDEVRAPASAR